jgi:dTDP-4-dehydrorhamnose reductase
MINIAILGSTGMLGSALTKILTSRFGKVIEFNRSGVPLIKTNECIRLDVVHNRELKNIFDGLKIEYLVNAIGMVKQIIDVSDSSDLQRAHLINSEFVSKLNEYSNCRDVPIIQIGTDCVFSGSRGNYVETDVFEPTDIYSKTKIAGECGSPLSMILRTSIVGREIRSSHSILEWVLSQELKSEINGFINHIWNGVTTFHFAKIVRGIIESNTFTPGRFHVIPKDSITKFELIKSIAENFQRLDLRINKFEAPISINRTLATLNPAINSQIWAQAGYDTIPSIEDMIREYAQWLSRPWYR